MVDSDAAFQRSALCHVPGGAVYPAHSRHVSRGHLCALWATASPDSRTAELVPSSPGERKLVGPGTRRAQRTLRAPRCWTVGRASSGEDCRLPGMRMRSRIPPRRGPRSILWEWYDAPCGQGAEQRLCRHRTQRGVLSDGRKTGSRLRSVSSPSSA